MDLGYGHVRLSQGGEYQSHEVEHENGLGWQKKKRYGAEKTESWMTDVPKDVL